MDLAIPGVRLASNLLDTTTHLGRGMFKSYARMVGGASALLESHDVPVGLTPKEAVWALNKARLYRYRPILPPEQRHPIPLLLVYALINKPFIFDLAPGRSFVQTMLETGLDVYLLDWGAPGAEDRQIRFDDYVTQYLARAVRRMVRVSGAQQISMLGYCLGGTLATVYAALYPEAPIRNLLLLAAPVDFSASSQGSIAMWVEEGRLDVDYLVDCAGNIPGELIREWAKLIKPMENYVGSYLGLLRSVGDPQAVQGWQAINRWVEDVIPVAGEAFRQYIKDYMWRNVLISGRHRIDGQRVDLANIKAALLALVAQYDHLVSPAQSIPIMDFVSSQDKTLKVIPSTHVGIMASRRAKTKLWPELIEWLVPRSSE